MIDLLIKGDLVLNDCVLRGGSVGVNSGKIIGIFNSSDCTLPSKEIIDVTGCLVYPGMVDAHVHCYSNADETFMHATRAAAAGGVTTIIEMPYDQGAPVTSVDVFNKKVALISKTCVVDVAMLATLRKHATPKEVGPLVMAGATGFKMSIYETDPDRFPRIEDEVLWQIMPEISKYQIPVGFHGEIDFIIEDLIKKAKLAGRTDPMSHYETRPPASETLAILKILELSHWTKVKLHIFHASQPRSIDLITWFKSKGLDVTVETCPHYLLLDADVDLPRLKAFAKINPSILKKHEREMLWEHVIAGHIDFISSDHAPWPLERKQKDNIFENSSGAPGLETSFPLMHDAMVEKRGLDPIVVAKLLCKNPAKRFALSHLKGSIFIGADADFAILDPNQEFFIDSKGSYSSAKWSPYDGYKIKGRVVRTVLRGQTIYDGRNIIAEVGFGQFLPGPGHLKNSMKTN